jgi:thioredoxin
MTQDTVRPEAVTDDTFDRHVLSADVPVRGPCRLIAPVLEQVAHEQRGSLKIAKLDVDANPHTAMQYGVHSLPTLILFKSGQPVERVVGYLPEAALLARLGPHLAE